MPCRNLLIAFSLILAASGAIATGQDESRPARTAAAAGDRGQVAAVARGEVVSELDPAIWRVHHARNGDYWFGSRDRGVYRFDGKSLVNFTTKDGLYYDPVGGIQEDQAGNIYFATSFDARSGRHTQGVSRFDGKAFSPLDVSDQAAPAEAWSLQPEDLWFGGGGDTGTVLRYDGKTLQRLALPSSSEGDDFLAAHPRSEYPNIRYSPYDTYVIFRDSRGHIWFGTAMLGACRYDGNSFSWLTESELRNGSFGTRSIVEDRDGRFWFCNSLHRYVVDVTGGGGPKFGKEEGIRDAGDPARPRIAGIMSSVVDNAGELWIATYGDGVWRYDGKDAIHYPVKDGDGDVTLYTICRDNQGILWLGTHTAGAYRFNGRAFEKFRP